MIIAGFSAYSRHLDFARFRAIATRSARCCSSTWPTSPAWWPPGLYPNPVPFADVVTTTTHKTLRGPRGGLILCRANPEIEKKLNAMVFPGTQGGPLMHVIAAKAVAFKEALAACVQGLPAAGDRQRARHGGGVQQRGYEIVSGGTDNHLMLVEPDRQGPDRQGRRRRAGPRAHHGEQELGAQRPAVALRHQRHPHRHAGDHHARLRCRRGHRARHLDVRHARRHR
jgi:glycine hydroxymethyltransferase